MLTRTLALLCTFVTPLAAEIVVFDFDGVSAPGSFGMIAPGFGNGPTLELINAALDNALPGSWEASLAPLGTPGAQNSVHQ